MGTNHKIRHEIGEVTTDTTEIQMIMGLLWIIICQSNGQCRRNGQIPRNVWSPKTEPGSNRKYEHTNYQCEIESVIKQLSKTNVEDLMTSQVNSEKS